MVIGKFPPTAPTPWRRKLLEHGGQLWPNHQQWPDSATPEPMPGIRRSTNEVNRRVSVLLNVQSKEA